MLITSSSQPYVKLREKDEGALSDALGVSPMHVPMPQLPPGMDVTGGVTRLGWLKCNGEKRWVKVGHEFLEVWVNNTVDKHAARYVWTKWAVLSLQVDLGREEPALKARLGAVDKGKEVVLLLQAYEKDSEPTQADRAGHLMGFADELKLHLVPNASVEEIDLTADLDSPPKAPGSSPPARAGGPAKRPSPSSRQTPPAQRPGAGAAGAPPQAQSQTPGSGVKRQTQGSTRSAAGGSAAGSRPASTRPKAAGGAGNGRGGGRGAGAGSASRGRGAGR